MKKLQRFLHAWIVGQDLLIVLGGLLVVEPKMKAFGGATNYNQYGVLFLLALVNWWFYRKQESKKDAGDIWHWAVIVGAFVLSAVAVKQVIYTLTLPIYMGQ